MPMAADVTSLVRMMETYKEEAEGNRRGLFTRDLLGEGDDLTRSSKELDLDLQVPSGWERRLDLLSGETYLHRVDPNPARRGLQDLNLPPSLPEDSALLDLKLSGGGGSRGEYQSVCTLEKVRSALERAGRVSVDQRWRQTDTTSASPSVSPSSSMNSSSAKRKVEAEDDDGGSNWNGGMMAAACPSCLLYVLISKKNPRCPRCDTLVPFPFIPKKTKIDLNSSAS